MSTCLWVPSSAPSLPCVPISPLLLLAPLSPLAPRRSFLIVVPTAFYIVLAFPYNPHETLPTLLAGTYMLGCLANALRLIRQLPPKVQAHREWMTRAWAISLAIGLVRLLFLVAHYGAGISGMR